MRPGMLEPALLCETSEAVITQFAGFGAAARRWSLTSPRCRSWSRRALRETYQIPTALTASADRDLEIAAA
jgi:hypothetical protein